MKIMRSMLLIGVAGLLAVGAQAGLLYTFDADTEGFGGFNWFDSFLPAFTANSRRRSPSTCGS